MRALVLASLLFLAPGYARSDAGEPALTPAEEPELADRAVYVRVEKDAAVRGARVAAAVEIMASAETIWRIMVDCEQAPKIVPHLKSCRIIDSPADGSYDVREHRIDYGLLLPSVSSVFRSDYAPYREIRFQKAGGDLRHLDGVWTLDPGAAPGATRVSYRSRVAVDAPVPKSLMRSRMRADVRTILESLRKEAESEERSSKPS